MFYTGLHIAYAVLLCAALWLNRACWRSLLLTAILGVELTIEIPWVWPTWVWYLEWFMVEMLVVCLALSLNVAASRSVALFSALLGAGHLAGAYYGPSDAVGPYRLIQPMLEVSQLLSCLALSNYTTQYLQRRTLRAFNPPRQK